MLSSRVRQSGGSGLAISQRLSALVEKPEYEPLANPLTTKQQQALHHLARAQAFSKLDGYVQKAIENLTFNAGAVQDQVRDRRDGFRKQKSKAEQRDEDLSKFEEVDKEIDGLQARADQLTRKLEEGVRKMIDTRHTVQSVNTALSSISKNAITSSQVAARTQTQQSRLRGDGEMSDVDMEDPRDPTTNPADAASQPIIISKNFMDTIEDDKMRYQSHSLAARYTENNDFIGFKSIVHDAKHREDEVQPPHPSTWFNEGIPEAGVTNVDADDSDDDIAVSRANISTRCPLTLAELKEPYTSKKCRHSYEKKEILHFIKSTGRRGPVRCPVSGCDKVLTADDLAVDQIIVRKIRRIQKSREQTSRSSPVHSRAQSVDSDSGEDIDELERRTQRAPRMTTTSFEQADIEEARRQSRTVEVSDDVEMLDDGEDQVTEGEETE